eukprot:COSAG01_NODE_24424_length_779_cov_1.369118_1_plen_242_part_01
MAQLALLVVATMMFSACDEESETKKLVMHRIIQGSSSSGGHNVAAVRLGCSPSSGPGSRPGTVTMVNTLMIGTGSTGRIHNTTCHPSGTASACRDLCQADPVCRSFTFVNSNRCCARKNTTGCPTICPGGTDQNCTSGWVKGVTSLPLTSHCMARGPCRPGREICGPELSGVNALPGAPRFHIMDRSCQINDPNAPFFDPVHKMYHLMYQDHLGLGAWSGAWSGAGAGPTLGHVVSRDLVHW